MKSRSLREVIAGCDAFSGLSAAAVELMGGCARQVAFARAALLVEEGQPAETFYLIRRGEVSLEVHEAGRGGLAIERVAAGGAVGWSWLFPPYRWHFDARALTPVGAIAFDGACLREHAAADHALGYELVSCFAALMLERLQAAELRLLDLYGHDR